MARAEGARRNDKTRLKMQTGGTSPAAQILGLCLPMQGVCVRSLMGALRSHMPHNQKKKT